MKNLKSVCAETGAILTARILLLFFGTALCAGTLLSVVIRDLVNPMPYEQGQVASYTIRAPREVLIEDVLNTEDRRSQAANAVRRVFRIDDAVLQNMQAQLNALFSTLHSAGSSPAIELSDEQKKQFEVQFRVDLVGGEWDELLNANNWSMIADSVREIVEPILRRGVIANTIELERGIRDGAAILHSDSRSVEREINSLSDIYTISQANEVVETAIPSSVLRRNEALQSVVKKLARALIQANTMYDAAETERRIAQARDRVAPIYFRVRRGEVIVRQGDVISASQEQRLQQMRSEVGSEDALRSWAGHVALSFLILTCCYSFLSFLWPNQRRTFADLALICLTLIGNLILLKVFALVATALGESFNYLDSDALLLSAPLSAGGILLQVTVGATGVLLYLLSFALLTGMFLQNSWLVLVLIVAGNCIGALAVRKCSRRSSFISAGLRVGIVNILVVSCFILLYGEAGVLENVNRILWALFGGIMSGVLAGGIAPIAEVFGGYITDIKLLELASLDRPLLRDLSLQAPGTWNHSMVIGQMGEAAAEAIGANGLLVRVGAYYHDIGKMKKPAYFVENQTEKNPHDKLTPSMSALIIKSHVKDGLELAREYRLPQAIMDFIPQHHGTSLISYFYTKAVRDAEADEVVEESHYRYQGPKPQSKEAGILMLADVVEASSRTISGPTPAKIQGLVQKSINRVFANGELEESDLTLQDLHKIAKTFTRVLNGIYHRRVEYSAPAEKTKESKVITQPTAEHPTVELTKVKEGEQGSKKNGGRDSREGSSSRAAQESGAQSTDDDKTSEALKRLGMQ